MSRMHHPTPLPLPQVPLEASRGNCILLLSLYASAHSVKKKEKRKTFYITHIDKIPFPVVNKLAVTFTFQKYK